MHANLRRQTLADTLRRTAARVPDRLGLACGETRWTYREFHAVSERLAAALLAAGDRRGDKVAILARNSHGFVALRFALARLGAVLVPINFMLKPDEVAFILRHAGARMLATDSGLATRRARCGRARHLGARVHLAAVGGADDARAGHDDLRRAGRDASGDAAGARRCQQRSGADRLHERHRIAPQGRHADPRRGDLAVRELRGRRRRSPATI